MILLNHSVQRFLFFIIGSVLTVALLPMGLFAPQSETTELMRAFNAAAWNVPGPRRPTPYFLPGDAEFCFEPGEHWTMGFAARNLTADPVIRERIEAGHFNVAGYARTLSESVMDDMYARAFYLNDNTGRGGMLYAVVDCIGLSDTDVNRIRALVWDWAQEAGLRSIQIAATHMHSGIDTIGLWSDIPHDGKDPAFQQHLIEQTAQALRAAFENRQDGRLFVADTVLEDMIEDTRYPYVFDEMLTRFRFEADNGTEIYLLSAGIHPGMMGPLNPQISADFPAYAIRHIYEQTGAAAMFIQGAIGGLITVPNLYGIIAEHDQGNITYGPSLVPGFGQRMGQFALGEIGNLSEEAELPAVLNIASRQMELPIENIALLISVRLGMINHGVYRAGRGYFITIEIGYLRLGDLSESVDILIVPGELAPELAFGGFLCRKQSANRRRYPRPAIFEALNRYEFASQRQIVFGLANNFIGYIIPENDFYLDRWLPYFDIAHSRGGRRHYEETVSAGPQTGRVISEGFFGMFSQLSQ